MEEKFKIYDKRNERSLSTKDPMLAIYKNGVVRLNQAAVNLMNLNEGNEISFRQNNRDPKDWALLVSNTGSGYRLRKMGGFKGLGFNASVASNAIRQALRATGIIKVPIATAADVDGSWGLITSAVRS